MHGDHAEKDNGFEKLVPRELLCLMFVLHLGITHEKKHFENAAILWGVGLCGQLRETAFAEQLAHCGLQNQLYSTDVVLFSFSVKQVIRLFCCLQQFFRGEYRVRSQIRHVSCVSCLLVPNLLSFFGSASCL